MYASKYMHISKVYYNFPIDLMPESVKLIIMCAFGAHSFKEISRSQLVSAVKHHIHENKRNIAKLEKQQLVEPLAAVLIEKGIITIREGAASNSLKRSNIFNAKPF